MFGIIKKILSVLSKKERRQLLWLIFVIIVVGLFEVAGIASITPLMAVIGKPEIVENNRYLYKLYQRFGFASVNTFMIFLGLFVFFMILLSNGLKVLLLWLSHRFFHFRSLSLSQRLLFSYLNRPYTFFLNQNTAILGKNILQEVSMFIHGVLRQCSMIFSQLVVVLFILGLLLVVGPILAVMIASTVGSTYAVLYLIVQRKLSRLGEERFESNAKRFKAASEAFGGIKEIKLLRRERFYFDYFSINALKVEKNLITVGLISHLPRYIMEVLAVGGILIILLYFLLVRPDFGKTLPIISLYAFAGYRLMPALQSIFTAVSEIRFHLPTLNSIHSDLSGITEVPAIWQQEKLPPMTFRDNIQLVSITFTYPGSGSPVIKELNLTIKKNSIIGLIGMTGSGKTTLVDILLGLLIPEQGSILVDGVKLSLENLPKWQRNFGYVPQFIFLSDDSVAQNIAFGIPPELIDMEAVERASRIANLHDFVLKELPKGYATPIGERGLRLSGGQRQRIGIARALYHDPEILIMDEATSSLDGITEEAVTQAIRNLSGKKTIITIAHRLTTLKDCDIIYLMDNGKIIEYGSYAELLNCSNRFKAMSGLTLS